MASAAGTLKRLTLELGGNDAAIVLEDADPKEVAPKIYAAATIISGQACIAIKRLYVHDSIYDAICDELGRLARATVVGDGLEPGTQMGPLQNKAQFDKVKGFLEDARQHGKIVVGGAVLEREGYFVQPTIVRDIVPGLVRPQSRGYLRMKTAEHDGPLEIQPNFLQEQADVDAMVAGVELGLDIAQQPAFRDLIKSWVAPPRRMSREETAAFVRRACSSYFHPVGTCAMGSGRDAVVDAELRAHGALGLRIADASVMPTITSANTNAPTIMIGEFASRLQLAG